MSDQKHLSVPLGASFEDRLPEGRVHALWRRIEVARAKRRPTSRTLAGGLALAAALAAVVSFFFASSSPPRALHLADGREVPASLGRESAAAVAFDDGSHVDLAAGARLDVLESTSSVFGLALRSGSSEFEVHPGGPRSWRIECGGVTVEVVGTHFTLQRSAAFLLVTVARGAVIVRGTRVPDGVVRLGAGQSITISLVDAAQTSRSATTTPEPSVPESQTPPPGAPREPAKEMAVAGGSDEIEVSRRAFAPAVLESAGAPSPAAPAITEMDVLLADADGARRAARFGEAARLLERALAEHPGDARVPLAEFSLGRLYLDSLGDPQRAASYFSLALASHLPAALAEDAQARLVEAYARANDAPLASQAASRYRALYPAGRRSADVERWASSVR